MQSSLRSTSIEVSGIRFAYDELGDPTRPPLILTHSLVWDRQMFSAVAESLAQHYRVLSIDLHGHGGTGDSPMGERLTLEQMADDCAALLSALGFDHTPVHWAGLSMGGMVGMRLAIRHPGKLRSLILMDTSAQPEEPARTQQYLQLAGVLRAGKAESVVDFVLPFFFCPSTYAEQPELIAEYRKKLLNSASPDGLYHAALAVFTRDDFTAQLAQLDLPTLVLVGAEDISTIPLRSKHLVRHIRGARMQVIADAGHMSATEKPGPVATAIRDFLAHVAA